MNWNAIRGVCYGVAIIIGTAIVATNIGTFDPETGMVDLHPFNLYTAIAAGAAMVGAPLTALVALVKGWGRK